MVVRYRVQLVQEGDKKNQCECFRIKFVQTGTDTSPATERRVTDTGPLEADHWGQEPIGG